MDFNLLPIKVYANKSVKIFSVKQMTSTLIHPMTTRKDVMFMKEKKLNLIHTQLAGQVMTLKEFVLQVKRIDFVNIYKLVEIRSNVN